MTHLTRLAPCVVALLLAIPFTARGVVTDPPGDPQGPTPGEQPPPPPAAPPAQLAGEQAPPPPPASPQARRREPPRWRAAVAFGSGTTYGHSYTMFGGLLGYQLAGGFELFLDGQYWGGANPHLGRLAPGINWYAPVLFRPYVGVYYARWFVGAGLPDRDALGGRAGLTLATTTRATFGAGMAYERDVDCATRCEAWWPELSFGLRF